MLGLYAFMVLAGICKRASERNDATAKGARFTRTHIASAGIGYGLVKVLKCSTIGLQYHVLRL